MENPILFKFLKMDLTQFAIFVDNYPIETQKLGVCYRFQFAYNFEEHLVLCKTIIELSDNDKLVLKADLDCFFKIEEESAFAIEFNDEATLHPVLLVQLASLAYGSMRGVLYAKTLGTPLNNFILPPSEISPLLKDPLKFSQRQSADSKITS